MVLLTVDDVRITLCELRNLGDTYALILKYVPSIVVSKRQRCIKRCSPTISGYLGFVLRTDVVGVQYVTHLDLVQVQGLVSSLNWELFCDAVDYPIAQVLEGFLWIEVGHLFLSVTAEGYSSPWASGKQFESLGISITGGGSSPPQRSSIMGPDKKTEGAAFEQAVQGLFDVNEGEDTAKDEDVDQEEKEEEGA